jgi:hypothetical protein
MELYRPNPGASGIIPGIVNKVEGTLYFLAKNSPNAPIVIDAKKVDKTTLFDNCVKLMKIIQPRAPVIPEKTRFFLGMLKIIAKPIVEKNENKILIYSPP